MLKKTKEEFVLSVKVIPNAKKNAIIGWKGEELSVKLAAIPEKGQANTMLIRFLAKILGIGSSKLTLVFGAASRHKRVAIKNQDLSENEIIARLSPHAD
jgi:uncharacterized protein